MSEKLGLLYRQVADAVSMDHGAFRDKYLNDGVFHALVEVCLIAQASIAELEGYETEAEDLRGVNRQLGDENDRLRGEVVSWQRLFEAKARRTEQLTAIIRNAVSGMAGPIPAMARNYLSEALQREAVKHG